MSDADYYPPNPGYGKGCYRRRIRLTASESAVIGELEDNNHGMRVTVEHDGERVTKLEPDIRRIPFDTCPGAGQPLQALRGLNLSHNAAALIRQTQPNANCTHLFDLTILAICQATRYLSGGPSERLYDITLQDQPDEKPAAAEIYRDGKLIHRWLTHDWVITAPESLAGNVLLKGFREWASEYYCDDDELEAAFALQKGYFVGHARRYNLASLTGEPALNHKDYMYGVCYTYSSPQIETARRTADSNRDFSDCPEQLLQFGATL